MERHRWSFTGWSQMLLLICVICTSGAISSQAQPLGDRKIVANFGPPNTYDIEDGKEIQNSALIPLTQVVAKDKTLDSRGKRKVYDQVFNKLLNEDTFSGSNKMQERQRIYDQFLQGFSENITNTKTLGHFSSAVGEERNKEDAQDYGDDEKAVMIHKIIEDEDKSDSQEVAEGEDEDGGNEDAEGEEEDKWEDSEDGNDEKDKNNDSQEDSEGDIEEGSDENEEGDDDEEEDDNEEEEGDDDDEEEGDNDEEEGNDEKKTMMMRKVVMKMRKLIMMMMTTMQTVTRIMKKKIRERKKVTLKQERPCSKGDYGEGKKDDEKEEKSDKEGKYGTEQKEEVMMRMASVKKMKGHLLSSRN